MRKYVRVTEKRNSKVSHWTWTKNKGLWVTFTDGTTCRSEYSLRELLSGKCEGLIKRVF